jgi:hypothetical protein
MLASTLASTVAAVHVPLSPVDATCNVLNSGCGCVLPHRLRDVLFLDLALELAGRGALEAGLSAIRSAAPSTMLGGLLALLQQPLASACMSALPGQGGSAALVSVAGQLAMLSQDCPGRPDRAVQAMIEHLVLLAHRSLRFYAHAQTMHAAADAVMQTVS